jgi:hypothetical protein
MIAASVRKPGARKPGLRRAGPRRPVGHRAGSLTRLWALQLALVAVLAALQGCAPAASGPARPASRSAAASSDRAAAATYVGGGVRVTVGLVRAGPGGRVEVTFTPAAGFHLYSTALQLRQTHGLGVATRVSVQGGLRATGPVTASQPVRMLRIAVLHATLPVFPDGPVTVAVPVRMAGSRTAGVIVSYAACSASVCLMPVIGHRIVLHVS